MPWGPFDEAVDGFIVEVLVDVASIAGDPGFRSPAVDVSVEGVKGGSRRGTWRGGKCIPVESEESHCMSICNLLCERRDA